MRHLPPIAPCPPPPTLIQRGGIVMPMILSILVLGASTLALQAARQTRQPLAEQRTTEQRMDSLGKALKAYAVIQVRLPCPARGNALTTDVDFGLSSPNAATPTCTSPDGIVPWRTLGISQSDAMDGWGRFISYRVPVDTVGPPATAGMTRVNAADMTNCDTWEPSSVAPTAPAFACTPSLDVLDTTFLNSRTSLTVRVNGTDQPQIAWVLISHGPTGLGAWRSGQNPASRVCGLPQMPALNSDECNNILASPAFFVQRSPEVLAAGGQPLNPQVDTNHFDDVVRFQNIKEFIASTGRGASNWPEAVAPNTPSVPFTEATLDTSGVTFTGFSSNQQILTIPAAPLAPPSPGTPGVTVAVQPGQQITIDNLASPPSGLGVCQSVGICDATNAELSGTETLSFKLVNATAYKLGLALKNFNGGETALITFKRSGAQVGEVVSHTGPFNASNRVPTVPSAAFDEVVIGAGGTSSFFIDAVRFCDASTSTACAP